MNQGCRDDGARPLLATGLLAAAVAATAAQAAVEPLPFEDRYASCTALPTGTPESRHCADRAVVQLTNQLAAARRAGADARRITRIESRLSMATGLQRTPRPAPSEIRRAELTPADVARTRRLLAASALVRTASGGQRPRIRMIGSYAQSNPYRKIGSATTLVWTRPVSRRDVRWPQQGGCDGDRPSTGVRIVTYPEILDLTAVTVTLDLRSGRIVQVLVGPDEASGRIVPPAATRQPPDPSAALLTVTDVGGDIAATRPASPLGAEGMSASLRCQVAAAGAHTFVAATFRRRDPDVRIAAAVATAGGADSARRLLGLAEPVARVYGVSGVSREPGPTLGDEAVWFAVPSRTGRPGGLAVVWRRGGHIGMVFIESAASAPTVLDLARRQDERMARLP